MDNFAPVVHSLKSTSTHQGIEAIIFIESPKSFKGVELIDVAPNTVFLSKVEPKENFLPFSETVEKAIQMPIQVYLNFLLFLQTTWPNIESTMNAHIKEMRTKTSGVPSDSRIHIYMQGSCVYQHWFNDVFFHAIRKTHDYTRHNSKIHLQKENKSFEFDGAILSHLSSNLENLIFILKQSGYVFPPSISQVSV